MRSLRKRERNLSHLYRTYTLCMTWHVQCDGPRCPVREAFRLHKLPDRELGSLGQDQDCECPAIMTQRAHYLSPQTRLYLSSRLFLLIAVLFLAKNLVAVLYTGLNNQSLIHGIRNKQEDRSDFLRQYWA